MRRLSSYTNLAQSVAIVTPMEEDSHSKERVESQVMVC